KRLTLRKLFRNTCYQSGLDAIKNSVKGYKVTANIIMFRRKALEEVNYITGRPDYVEDYHLSTTLASKGWGNVYSNELLACYRLWLDSGNVRQRRKMLEIVGLTKVFSEIIEPAYLKNAWETRIVQKRRSRLASAHADCLGWKVYT